MYLQQLTTPEMGFQCLYNNIVYFWRSMKIFLSTYRSFEGRSFVMRSLNLGWKNFDQNIVVYSEGGGVKYKS